MDGAGVGGTCLAAVLEENERAPALAFSGSAWTVLEWRHSPGGSAGREGEDTSTSLGGSAWIVQE